MRFRVGVRVGVREANSAAHAFLASSTTGARSTTTPRICGCACRMRCTKWPRPPPTSTTRENLANGPSSTIAAPPMESIEVIARPNWSSCAGFASNLAQIPPWSFAKGYCGKARSHAIEALDRSGPVERKSASFPHAG